MKASFNIGFSFGFTSGIITTLGLIVGLHSGTHSKLAILSGILTIAIADAFSDAMGIHISEESENNHCPREIWESTVSTFLTKFILASTFIIPILLFELLIAIIVAASWGIILLIVFSFSMAKKQKKKSLQVVSEHIAIALLVIFATHYLGHFCQKFLAG